METEVNIKTTQKCTREDLAKLLPNTKVKLNKTEATSIIASIYSLVVKIK